MNLDLLPPHLRWYLLALLVIGLVMAVAITDELIESLIQRRRNARRRQARIARRLR